MANLIFGGHKIGSSSLQFSAARGVFSEVENTTQPVGAGDGEMLVRSHLKSRIIPVTYDFVALSRREFERQLAPLLYSSDVQKLIIDDRPDEFWYAKVDGKIDMDRAYFLGTGTINFLVPDGIAHSVATQTADNMPYKDVPVNLLKGSGEPQTVAAQVWGDDPHLSLDTSSLKIGDTVSFQVKVDGVKDTNVFVGLNSQKISPLFSNGMETFAITWTKELFDLPLPIEFSVKPAALTDEYTWSQAKAAIGTTASPWSPNPADPEYYTDTITVPNAGTYPSEPVITATVNGDDGVLTAINDQGSVLQFGSPDETDGFVKQKSERVYHLDFNQTPTGVTLNNGVTAFPYYEHGNDANVQSGPFGYKDGIAYPSTERTAANHWNGPSMSGTIPKNSNGSNTANFQFVNRVNVGTNAAEVGRFEFNLTYQGRLSLLLRCLMIVL
ncbi:phage-related tail component, partial [Lacticaseibacillus paracasei subsp. paracasei Lpp14]